MEDLTFLEKINYLWNTLIQSKETKFILPLIAIIVLTVIISFFFKKRTKSIYFTIYLVMVATLFIMFYNPIINMLSTLFQKVIDYVLFPNLMLYLIIVIVANIVLIATILNNNLSRFIKGVNVILFSFMQVLLFFIMLLFCLFY